MIATETETENETIAYAAGRKWAAKAHRDLVVRVKWFAERGQPQESETSAGVRLLYLLTPDARDSPAYANGKMMHAFWPRQVPHDDAAAARAWVRGVLDFHEQQSQVSVS